MAAFHRIANLAHTRLLLPSAWRVESKACVVRSLSTGRIAIGTIGDGSWQASNIDDFDGDFSGWWRNDQGLQNLLGLYSIVGVRSGDHHSQGHALGIARQVDRRAGLGAVYRTGTRLFTPFFDGFLEPSMRI